MLHRERNDPSSTPDEPIVPTTNASSHNIEDHHDHDDEYSLERETNHNGNDTNPTNDVPANYRTSSGRISRPPARYSANYLHAYPSFVYNTNTSLDAFIADIESALLSPIDPLVQQIGRINFADESLFNDPYARKAKHYDSDNPSYSMAMNGPYKENFQQAMKTELHELNNLGTFEEVDPKSIPPGTKLLNYIWTFKIKRLPSFAIRKFKARLCIRGNQQEYGVNYWETYAPVVSWTTVRLLFILSIIHNLHTTQVDYTNAYCQATFREGEELYMKVPTGYKTKRRGPTVLKIIKPLYGAKQAGRTFYLHIREQLLLRGFEQSCLDPCLFFSPTVVVLIYVDDCIFFSKNKNEIQKIVQSLRKSFTMTDEGDYETYLGVKVNKLESGIIELTQPHIIHNILTELNLLESNSKPTPATTILHKDSDGETRQHSWNYRRIIGMLEYLRQSTRPDIAFAVHQCARFCNDPKRSHEMGIMRIGRYLKGTIDKGILFNPNNESYLTCYVDADFAGLWSVEDPENPSSTKSRTGFVLMYAGSPLLWCSKLQTITALSTTESEYIALSHAMRETIPAKELLYEITKAFQLKQPDKSKMVCSIFEDNNSCIELAKCPKVRPRTKHIAIKYHFFREKIESGEFKIEPIETTEQIADLFTKPLTEKPFKYLRQKLLGW